MTTEEMQIVELALNMAEGLLSEIHAETSSVRFTDRGDWAGRSKRVLERLDQARNVLIMPAAGAAA